MKNCPYCAEEIKSDAVKCRYCGEWLNKQTDKQNISPIKKDLKIDSSSTDETDNIETVSKENNDIEKAKRSYNKGNQEFESGNYQKAIEYYSEAIKLNPKYYRAYANRGISYQKIGRQIEAEKDLKIAENMGSSIAKEYLNSFQYSESITFSDKIFFRWQQMSLGKKVWTSCLTFVFIIFFLLFITPVLNDGKRGVSQQQVEQNQRLEHQSAQTQAIIETQEAQSRELLDSCRSSCRSSSIHIDLNQMSKETDERRRCENKCEQEALTRNIEIGKLREMQKQR